MAETMTDSFNSLIANDIQQNLQQQTETTQETTQGTTQTTTQETTQVVAPVAVETKETPTFNQAEWLKTEFGVEDINAVKERYTGYDTLKQELETVKAAPPTVQP